MSETTGRCLCGAVRFRFAGTPITVRQCWCRDCQYLAAGGATHNLFLKSDRLEWSGEVRWFESAADSGTMLGRAFCPTCGTDLFVQSHTRRHLIGVRVGALDHPAAAAPASAIWTESAPAWACLDPDLPQEPRQPGPLK